jgi:hypothetical protein
VAEPIGIFQMATIAVTLTCSILFSDLNALEEVPVGIYSECTNSLVFSIGRCAATVTKRNQGGPHGTASVDACIFFTWRSYIVYCRPGVKRTCCALGALRSCEMIRLASPSHLNRMFLLQHPCVCGLHRDAEGLQGQPLTRVRHI